MSPEIKAAVQWLLELIAGRSLALWDPEGELDLEPMANEITLIQLAGFERQLKKILKRNFENHWHVRQPTRDQAFRAIHVCPQFPVNQFIKQAADYVNIPYEALNIHIMTFTLWIDPKLVTARYNDSDPKFVVKEW